MDANTMVRRLCVASRRQFTNPYEEFAWQDSIDADRWCMTPELISLNGTPAYDALTEVEKRKLSFFEAVNFFSLTLHGEQMFIRQLVTHLYRKPFVEVTEYLQHFLDEEMKHIVAFGEFCRRYAGKVYPDRHVGGSDKTYAAGVAEVVFFSTVLIFEELGNYYNHQMARDAGVNPIVREINAYHRREEARHIAFGRHIVKDLFDRFAPAWSAETLAEVREHIEDFVTMTWKEYFNPDVYRDAGIAGGYALYEAALKSPASEQRLARALADTLPFFVDNRILEPAHGRP